MSFIDEAAKEINVKVVWYSASPRTAAAIVRLIADRTRPDLKRVQTLELDGGLRVEILQFVPAALGEIRGFSTRFHLYAIDSTTGALESPETRSLVFRGADACVFVADDGDRDVDALARMDGILAAQNCVGVACVLAVENVDAAAAVARGRTFGFPAADSFAVDVGSGAGVFDAFKALAKKLLSVLAGKELVGRPTPPPGAPPIPSASAPAKTWQEALAEVQEGLDEWQRAYHFKAIWTLGPEEARLRPTDVPDGIPPHTVHALRLGSGDGFALMTNGFSRTVPVAGAARLELRADVAAHGWQIAQTLSFLGRLAFMQLRSGGDPWLAYDVVTTKEAPLFGFEHFVLMPAGAVLVEEQPVTILRVVPITPDEHREIAGRIHGEERIAWLAARAATMPTRWAPALARDRPFDDG